MTKVMCAYGNCDKWVGEGSFKITITESSNSRVHERQAFCCYFHAASWLRKREKQAMLRVLEPEEG